MVGASRVQTTPAEAVPSSWSRRMRPSTSVSSPAMPPKYHFTWTWPLVLASTSRANARNSRANAVPSGAAVAMRRRCGGSARAAVEPADTKSRMARAGLTPLHHTASRAVAGAELAAATFSFRLDGLRTRDDPRDIGIFRVRVGGAIAALGAAFIAPLGLLVVTFALRLLPISFRDGRLP